MEALLFPNRSVYRALKKECKILRRDISPIQNEDPAQYFTFILNHGVDISDFANQLAAILVNHKISINEKSALISSLSHTINKFTHDVRDSFYQRIIVYSYCYLALNCRNVSQKSIDKTAIRFISMIKNPSSYPLVLTYNLYALYFADIITKSCETDTDEGCSDLIKNPFNYGFPTSG